MTGSDEGVHVLLVSYPAQGHINPLVQFGKRLAAHRGVRCTLAVARSVLGSSQPPRPGAIRVVTFSDGCDHGGYDEVGDVHAYLARLESGESRTLDELLGTESSQGRPVRVVVYDAFLPWVLPVARRHGASCAAFFTQACVVNISYAHAWAGKVKLPVHEVLAELPGLPRGLEPADFSTFLTEQDRNSAYLDLLLQQCQGLEMGDHVLVNSFYELQTELHTPMMAECKTWLDKRPKDSVVYISFGSHAEPSAAQLAEMADGLYNSSKDFLWVVRDSEASKLPEGFVDRAKDRGLVVTWSPQLDVLMHHAVGCFVTHCGWNSTTEGLGIGLPMVAMPQWSDQPMNAKYIEDIWKVGVRAWPDVKGIVRKEEVERCVREVMEGEKSNQYRENASNWREKAKRATSESGSSYINIMKFLGQFGLNC
ncbi:hypothetical protein HU200_021762 [Digitaria exilis]|uniref:Glycosyltransferase n=1 Tax=Digitaria exilis TaxID=1010633 RepID=A0A835EYT8_9POAL|nr:hypothetical protein HU200_021762 [Digitaria exilis]